MKLKKTKKDIIESIKSVSSKKKNEMFEVDSKVQAVASPSFVDALEMSAKNKQMVIDRMKEKEKERKEFMKQTVERTANKTPKSDAMKKMKMVEEFINESFKDKLTINENIFTVTTKLRTELKKLIENARKHEVKYTIERINEEYKFNYKFKYDESKKINEERKYVAGFFSAGKKDSYTEMSGEKWNSLDSDVKVKDLLDMWWNSVRIKGKGIKGEALLYKDCHDGSYELDEEHNSHGEDILNMTVHTHYEYDEDGDDYPIIYAKLLSKEVKESVKSAYDSGDMFETYEEFVKIDKNKTETIATKTIQESELAKEIGIKSIKGLFSAFEQDGGNDDVDALFLEVIQALDEEFDTHLYEGYLKEEKASERNKKLTVEKAKTIAYDKLSYGDYKNLMTMDDDYIIDYVSTELVEDKLDESKINVEKCKDILNNQIDWTEVDEYGDVDFARDQLRSLHSEGEISDDEYNYIIINWDNLLESVSKDSTLKEEKALTTSPYKDIISSHFDYSVDFEFLDIIADILDRIDFEEDLDDEIDVAIDDSLVYIRNQWTVAEFYVTSPADLDDWYEVLNDLSNDIHAIAKEIIETKED